MSRFKFYSTPFFLPKIQRGFCSFAPIKAQSRSRRCVLGHHRCVVNQQRKSLESRIRYSASPEQPKWEGTSQKWGALKFAYKNWFQILYGTIMRNFKIRPPTFLSSFRLWPIIAWKIYLQQWMLPDVRPGFCWERLTKCKFFYTKTAWFSPRAEQTDATQACHRRT